MKWETVSFNVDSPTEVLSLYSERLFGSRDWESLDAEKLQTLFVHLLSDFYDHGISLDVLTLVSSMINDLVVDKDVMSFVDVLVSAHELDSLIRRAGGDTDDGRELVGSLRDLRKYYIENKHKIRSNENSD